MPRRNNGPKELLVFYTLSPTFGDHQLEIEPHTALFPITGLNGLDRFLPTVASK